MSNDIIDESIDDTTNNNPVIGLKGSLSLVARLEYRLGGLLGTCVEASQTSGVLKVHILPRPYMAERKHHASTTVSNNSLRRFSTTLDKILRRLVRSEDGPERNTVTTDLERAIQHQVSHHTDACIEKLKRLFITHNEKFSKLVTEMTAIDDNKANEQRDRVLGDLLISFHQLLCAYNGKGGARKNELMKFAYHAIRNNDSLKEQLLYLLQTKFSTGLYDNMRDLSHLLRTQDTIVRAVTRLETVKAVKVYFGKPRQPSSDITDSSAQKVYLGKPRQPCNNTNDASHKLAGRELHPCQVRSQDVATLPIAIDPPVGETCAPTNPRPAGEDRDFDIASASPMFVQAVGVLAKSVIHHESVPVGSHAYYHFGFVTCRSNFDEDAICGYYRQFFGATQDPIILVEMINALQRGTLSGLLHNKDKQSLKNSYPSLHSFLTTKLEERSSVFRLIQFIRDTGNDEPAPVLRRDYGFQWCSQREHVTFLKNVYERMLARIEPIELHDACRFNRLRELAIEVFGSINKEMRRLMVNQYPDIPCGFDNDLGLGKYKRSQFKKSLKK